MPRNHLSVADQVLLPGIFQVPNATLEKTIKALAVESAGLPTVGQDRFRYYQVAVLITAYRVLIFIGGMRQNLF
jgi:hypothetical protein